MIMMSNEDRIKEKIEAVIQRLRPGFLENGGDLDFIEFRNGLVIVNFVGSHMGYPSSKKDVEEMIETELRKDIVEVDRVIKIEAYMVDESKY